MANQPFNISLGAGRYYHDRVKNNDGASAALVAIPLEAAGLVSDATMRDYDTVAAILAGASNEQTTMGRKLLTDADIVLAVVDDSGDVVQCSIPNVDWAAATGNPIGAFIIAFVPIAGTSTDSDMIPIAKMDGVATPDGNLLRLAAGVYFEAGHA